jgi:hypothetical protein
MAKIKKFKEYSDENEGFPKMHKVKKSSRHNIKQQIEQALEKEDWEKLEDEFYEQRHRIYRR